MSLCPLIFRFQLTALFRPLPLHASPHPNLTEASHSGDAEALIHFFFSLRYSELSDQRVVRLPAQRILGRAETKSPHRQVPFKIHLRNGGPVRQRAVLARTRLCASVHRPPPSSAVEPSAAVRLSAPVIMRDLCLELSCCCLLCAQFGTSSPEQNDSLLFHLVPRFVCPILPWRQDFFPHPPVDLLNVSISRICSHVKEKGDDDFVSRPHCVLKAH